MPEELGGVKVVIDPGHGGLDGGASSGMLWKVILHLVLHMKWQNDLKKRVRWLL